MYLLFLNFQERNQLSWCRINTFHRWLLFIFVYENLQLKTISSTAARIRFTVNISEQFSRWTFIHFWSQIASLDSGLQRTFNSFFHHSSSFFMFISNFSDSLCPTFWCATIFPTRPRHGNTYAILFPRSLRTLMALSSIGSVIGVEKNRNVTAASLLAMNPRCRRKYSVETWCKFLTFSKTNRLLY